MDKRDENDDSSGSLASEFDEDYKENSEDDSDDSSESEIGIDKPSTSSRRKGKKAKKTATKRSRESKINTEQEETFIRACLDEIDVLHDKTTKKGSYNSKVEREKKNSVWARIKNRMVEAVQVS